MEHYAALFGLVFMISFVAIFDLRRRRVRLSRLWHAVTLMSNEELERIRMIWAACEEA